MTETPLDIAHAAMMSDEDRDDLRLRFFEKLAEAELVLLLEKDPDGDAIEPEMFDLESGAVVLAFDGEERLAAFAHKTVPYVAMPGRALIALLAENGLGLALNFDVAPSSILLPHEALESIAAVLAVEPEEALGLPDEVLRPRNVPDLVLQSLDGRLGRAAGLARAALLAEAVYPEDRRHVLAFLDTAPQAERALAKAVNEALVFAEAEDFALDVIFLASGEELARRLGRVALRFDLPKPETPKAPDAPGMDPERPPRLH